MFVKFYFGVIHIGPVYELNIRCCREKAQSPSSCIKGLFQKLRIRNFRSNFGYKFPHKFGKFHTHVLTIWLYIMKEKVDMKGPLYHCHSCHKKCNNAASMVKNYVDELKE